MSSRKLRLTRRADQDIRDILRYSRETWGESQRNAYANRLQSSLDQLREFPDTGAKRDKISVGLRSHPTGSHLILYRFDDNSITIVRVVHERMDTANQFANEE